jgi:phosphoribosylformylglycinamidine synthase
LTIKNQALNYTFPTHFTGKTSYRCFETTSKAAIIRKGSNSGEMANAMYLAGFDVKTST